MIRFQRVEIVEVAALHFLMPAFSEVARIEQLGGEI
jgi:hypothetical protein